jgi:hypothetical protein
MTDAFLLMVYTGIFGTLLIVGDIVCTAFDKRKEK